MKYEVIHYFTDLQDFDHPYRVGDIFPRSGIKVSEERLKELSGSNNKQRKPLIKAVEDEAPEFTDNDITFEEKPKRQYTKTEINRMKTEELQEKAAEIGIENTYEMTGGELKKALIEYFGL